MQRNMCVLSGRNRVRWRLHLSVVVVIGVVDTVYSKNAHFLFSTTCDEEVRMLKWNGEVNI